MVEVKVVNLKEVSDYIKTLPDNAFDVLKKETAKSLLEADENIKTKTDLKRRTGNLFKSIQTRVSGASVSSFSARIFTDSIYAPIQEEGGTVKAKKAYRRVPGGPYLNIPSKYNLHPSLTMKLPAREVFRKGGYIRGRAVMLDGEPMFYLVKSVKIPPRLNMISSVEGVVPTLLSKLRDNIGK